MWTDLASIKGSCSQTGSGQPGDHASYQPHGYVLTNLAETKKKGGWSFELRNHVCLSFCLYVYTHVSIYHICVLNLHFYPRWAVQGVVYHCHFPVSFHSWAGFEPKSPEFCSGTLANTSGCLLANNYSNRNLLPSILFCPNTMVFGSPYLLVPS